MCMIILINRHPPNPMAIKDDLDSLCVWLITFAWFLIFTGVLHSAVAHSHADASGYTIPVFRNIGRSKSLKAANAKKPPTGVIIKTTLGIFSGITWKPIIVPKPRGSRKNASIIRAIEYPRQALNIFFCASQKSTVNPSEITARTIQFVVIRSMYAFILEVTSGMNAWAKKPKIATNTDTIIINKDIL